jgi:hypothetical protein
VIRIGGYLIDAAISEEESLDADVTEYPVESGAVITDHVRNRPRKLDLEFVVSDTPIGAAAGARAADVVPSSEARQTLEALRATRQPFSVVTSVRTYDNMVFTSLSFPRDGDTGDALRGKASLQQIEIVQVRRVSVKLSRRAARGAAGPAMWLCPEGVMVSQNSAENVRHKCRRIITKTDADGHSYPVFADSGVPLGEADIARLGQQDIEQRNANLVTSINNATGLSIPTDVPLEWDARHDRWVNARTGFPPSKEPTSATTFFEYGLPDPEEKSGAQLGQARFDATRGRF